MTQTPVKAVSEPEQREDSVAGADPAAEMARLVGQHYKVTVPYEVGREKVREFARAVQDDNPAHFTEAAAVELGYDDILAPLTFISILGSMALEDLFEHILGGYSLSRMLHTDQQVVVHRPIQVGDELYCDLSLHSFRQLGGSDIIVTKNDISDQLGHLVVTTLTTFIARTGGETEEEHVLMEAVDGVTMSPIARP